MRAFGHNSSQGPSWVVAIVLFVGLLVLVQLFRGPTTTGRPLEEQFAAQRPQAGGSQIKLPPLPTGVANLARTAASRLRLGGAAQALTPVAENTSLRVEIASIRPTADGLKISGQVGNVGNAPLPISLAAFRFSDGSGVEYAAEGTQATTLAPGQSVPLDLQLPIKDAGQLTLAVQLEGQPPLQMVLLQAPSGS
jgi:hypothetical protein